MTMTTRGVRPAAIEKRDASDNGPVGGGIVDTESNGQPSTDAGVSTQSPASLKQPTGPTTVATIKQ
jgi:hypothetical protein